MLRSGRARTAPRGRRRRRRHLEPDHLPEGDLLGRRLRRAAPRRARGRDATPRRSSCALAVKDVQDACDVLRPSGTRAAARTATSRSRSTRRSPTTRRRRSPRRPRLHELVDRPNLFVKIPATAPGLPAIEEMIARGKSINVTLIFSLERYARGRGGLRPRARAARRGGRRPARPSPRWRASSSRASTPRWTGGSTRSALRRRRCAGSSRSRTRSSPTSATRRSFARRALGARSPARGATTQRCLWASTSTKNPDYSDVLYVEELIGPRHGEHDAARRRSRRSRTTARVALDARGGARRGARASSRQVADGRRRLRRRHRDARARGRRRSSPTRSRSFSTASAAKRGELRRHVEGVPDEARHRRPRPHGRQHGGAPAQRRPRGGDVRTPARESTADSLVELVERLEQPRVVWLMVPAGEPTEQMFRTLLALLEPGDVIVDGGNSNFRDSIRRSKEAAGEGRPLRRRGRLRRDLGPRRGLLHHGRRRGGRVPDRRAGARSRSRPRTGTRTSGRPGAGHFVKMVHNGIEYGIMQAYAEGFELMQRGRSSTSTSRRSRASGSTARSSARWLLELLHARVRRPIRSSSGSRATSRTRARAAGPCTRRSTRPCLLP